MFTRLVIHLTEIERDALERLAAREVRPVKEQARVAVRKLLIEHGELPANEENRPVEGQRAIQPA